MDPFGRVSIRRNRYWNFRICCGGVVEIIGTNFWLKDPHIIRSNNNNNRGNELDNYRISNIHWGVIWIKIESEIFFQIYINIFIKSLLAECERIRLERRVTCLSFVTLERKMGRLVFCRWFEERERRQSSRRDYRCFWARGIWKYRAKYERARWVNNCSTRRMSLSQRIELGEGIALPRGNSSFSYVTTRNWSILLIVASLKHEQYSFLGNKIYK